MESWVQPVPLGVSIRSFVHLTHPAVVDFDKFDTFSLTFSLTEARFIGGWKTLADF